MSDERIFTAARLASTHSGSSRRPRRLRIRSDLGVSMGSVRHGRVGQAPEPGRRNPNSDKRASHQAVLPGRARTRFQTLRIDGVSRHFGSTVAVSDLNLTIEGGEFIALLGPSGCGKSTALNCLAGLLPLTTGGIWLDDERI